MWFASLGTYDRNPWFLSLLHKFLLGKPQVLGLLDVSHFEHQPPQFIKVDLYRYHFTENTTGFWKALLHKKYVLIPGKLTCLKLLQYVSGKNNRAS